MNGHYVALIKNPAKHSYYFSDSYGDFIDQQKPSEGTEMRERLYGYEDYNTLVKLLLDKKIKGWNIDFNNQTLQKGGDIATCGRHSLARCLFSNLDNDGYVKGLRGFCKDNGIDTDELVTILFN